MVNLGLISLFVVNRLHMQSKEPRFTFPGGRGGQVP